MWRSPVGPASYDRHCRVRVDDRHTNTKAKSVMTYSTLAFLGPIGWPEILVLLLLGLLIFGKRLPEVGKSLGQGIVEFKKGLSGVEDEIEKASREARKKEKSAPPPQLEEDKSETLETRTPEHSSTHGA